MLYIENNFVYLQVNRKIIMKKVSTLVIVCLCLVFAGCKNNNTGEPNTNDCSQQLSEAVQCKAELPACDGEKLKTSVQCLGLTSSKVRCSKNTLSPCGYCYLHEEQWTGQCPNTTKNACGYCDDHTYMNDSE